MVQFFFLVLTFLLTTDGLASGNLSLSDNPVMESSPKSKEIKKIAKLLEDPSEREKLIKTLKILAAAQEKEEKKKRDHWFLTLRRSFSSLWIVRQFF